MLFRSNTASLFDFKPQAKTFAGLLILDLVIKPVRTTMVVYQCDWSSQAWKDWSAQSD